MRSRSSRPPLRLVGADDFTPEGQAALHRLFNGSIMHGGTIGFLKPMKRRNAAEYFGSLQQGIADGDVIAVVAGAKPFDGFGLIRRDPKDELRRHCWEMGRVMVRHELQRHGLGAAIVQRLLAEAKRRKVEIVWLDVRITNVAAIELFQKLGFRTWGIFPNNIRDRRTYADVIYMACDLRHTYRPLRDLP
ncbi:MAG TPA: GNAT family N-acetyltransferase [Candidatus Krumholzibacteria bacterium]|nr:GNAT family N-acetyltransferase [Candidatus Krumholzibacteria bacterium]